MTEVAADHVEGGRVMGHIEQVVDIEKLGLGADVVAYQPGRGCSIDMDVMVLPQWAGVGWASSELMARSMALSKAAVSLPDRSRTRKPS